MSAKTLWRAAALMRERAEAATPGEWRIVPVGARADVRTEPGIGYDYRGSAVATAADSAFGCAQYGDAAHIASWHPAVALAVADWLDVVANTSATHRAGFTEALAVARAYLGEQP